MADIHYVVGDATQPGGDGAKLIVHVCNDIGGWGRGFVMALSRRWPEPEAEYRRWHAERETNDFGLGAVLFVPVTDDITVANLVGQHHIRADDGTPPIRYEAVREGLARVADHARDRGATVHMPRIGCGLAGGRWEMIEPIIRDTLVAAGVDVTVHDLEAPTEDESRRALQEIPGVGPSIAQDLLDLGLQKPDDLRHADANQLFARLCELRGEPIDPCVLYVFRGAVYFASHDEHDPELLLWWNWKQRPDPHHPDVVETAEPD